MGKVGPRKAVERRREDGDTSESKGEHRPRSQLGLFTEDAATGDTGKVGPSKWGEDGDTSESKGEHRPRSQLGLFMEDAAAGDIGKVGPGRAVERRKRMVIQARARASIALAHHLVCSWRMRLLAT